MLKQVLKVSIVAVVMMVVASPTWAGGLGVIFDDPTTGGGSGSYVLPYGSTPVYTTMTWQSCTAQYTNVADGPVPIYEPAAGSTFEANAYAECLAITNNTGSAITSMSLILTDPGVDTVTCLVSAPSTGFSCTSTDVGGVVTLDFSGIPGFGNNTEIYIGVGAPGDNVSDLGEPTLALPTYDPSTLMLLATGMALLAIGAVRRTA